MKISRRQITNLLMIVVGLLTSACAYRMYLIPCDIAPGGFTGIGQLVSRLSGGAISVGLVPLALNVPLFAITMHAMGWKIGVLSLAASTVLSFLLDYLPVPAVTDDMLLATVFGGVLGGLGFGLILRGGATTGGSDMLGKLLNNKMPFVRVSIFVFAVDALVILASAFVFDAQSAMYALISVLLMNGVLDIVLEGLDSARAYFIISEKSEEIAARIMQELERGVTGLEGRGVYSGARREVLLCVVYRMQAIQLRQLIKSVDPKAFIFAASVHEALGEGFKEY